MKKHLKIAAATPRIRLCDPEYNAELFAKCAKEADKCGADIIVFAELALTGATAGDLYFQEALTDAAESALGKYIQLTQGLNLTSFVGLPVRDGDRLYNAVACVKGGEVIGISASGAADRRFSAMSNEGCEIELLGQATDVSRSNIYEIGDTGLEVFVKVGSDSALSRDGVAAVINPVAEPEYLGRRAEREEYAVRVSEFLERPFLMVGAGEGESGTDGIYSSSVVAAKNGELLFSSEPFDEGIHYVDTGDNGRPFSAVFENSVKRFPFEPTDKSDYDLALEIQARSLAHRIERSFSKCAVIGVSGGLDSTLALLVAVRAMDFLGYSRDKVIAITMPCFGTSERTKSNALCLAEELGCTLRTIDIKAAVTQHFRDISHDEGCYDVVYENSQARERTQILMDVANAEGGLVIGTGDLSELALGFATYNGDHMSMYCVNGSVPKTLMRSMIAHFAGKYKDKGNESLSDVLFDVINTPVSPELLPITGEENAQHTETIVGPYELHDFFLYYTVKYGYSPSRVLELAKGVFDDYSEGDIAAYLDIFVRRFFSQQFKRSCLPDGPRVTEISLSPRGAWQMPSDVSGKIWRDNLAKR